MRAWPALGAIVAIATACPQPTVTPVVVDTDISSRAEHPTLAVTPNHKPLMQGRMNSPIYEDVYDRIVETAAADYDPHDVDEWDFTSHGRNARTAQANALLAWLHDDEEAAAKALDFLSRLPDDFETNTTWDANIRMPEPLMGYANTWDLLMGTDFITEEESQAAQATLTTITSQFYAAYVLDDSSRQIALGFSQNNHPIRTASAIGYVALAFPDHAESAEWLDWAMSELDYLWGPNGQYVQPDGGISEGTHYYGFAFAPSVAFFIAVSNSTSPSATYSRDCINRQEVEPWVGHGCVDGESFTFDNPIHRPDFHATAEWSASMRLPSGYRPPLADAYFTVFNGGAVLTGFGGADWLTWDWLDNDDDEPTLTTGLDLSMHHLAYMDTSGAATEPDFTSRVLPDAGSAVFRSGWDREARWLLLLAEAGSARKTLHDHVDGTSFSMAAYGEYLLMDPGYYKPEDFDNARTSAAEAHNVVLVDGEGAPAKGLLTNFGDADAFIENPFESASFSYVEAHQTYQQADFERSVIFVRDRYFVVADRIVSAVRDPRRFTWRLNGNAGRTAGGVFEIFANGGRWQRDNAGVDVYLGSTSPALAMVEPDYFNGYAPYVHEFDRSRTVGHHAVLDGFVTDIDPGFLAVLAAYPMDGDQPAAHDPITVEPVLAKAGQVAWAVTTDAGTDFVMLRGVTADKGLPLPTGEELSTDAEVVIMSSTLDAVLIVRGTHVTIDGDEVGVLSADPVSAWEATP